MDKRTKDFLALPREKQRVAIAKDVLEQLRLEKFKAQGGCYKTVYLNDHKSVFDFPKDASMQNVLKEKTEKCYVCARGAILLSTIRKGNECTVEDFRWNTNYTGPNIAERKYFEHHELRSMEGVFEGWAKDKTDMTFCTFLNERSKKLGYTSGSSECEKVLLAGICRNIIENDGAWVPANLVKKFPSWL